jgi:hypothetical protein
MMIGASGYPARRMTWPTHPKDQQEKGAHEDGGRGVARNAQRQRRDQGATAAAVVGGLGGDDAAFAFPVFLVRFGKSFRGGVGDEGADIAACARDGAEEGADQRRAD